VKLTPSGVGQGIGHLRVWLLAHCAVYLWLHLRTWRVGWHLVDVVRWLEDVRLFRRVPVFSGTQRVALLELLRLLVKAGALRPVEKCTLVKSCVDDRQRAFQSPPEQRRRKGVPQKVVEFTFLFPALCSTCCRSEAAAAYVMLVRGWISTTRLLQRGYYAKVEMIKDLYAERSLRLKSDQHEGQLYFPSRRDLVGRGW
jgi:hypothetical protein